MKILLTIILSLSIHLAHSQKLVDQFGYSSHFCSGTFYLYEDSSFVYERGCEIRSSITLGRYLLNNDTIYLYPIKLEEIKLIESVTYLDIDTSSYITTHFVSSNDSTVEPNIFYPSLEKAESWADKEFDTDSLKEHDKVKYNYENPSMDWYTSGNYSAFNKCFRTSSDTLAACSPDLERLLGNRKFFVVVPETNEIQIQLNLPYAILVRMINSEMIYEEFKSSMMEVDGRTIKIY